jgi:HD superfamily phosphodiesterase
VPIFIAIVMAGDGGDVRACETEPVANHSLRSYLFAVMLAEHEGLRPAADFHPDLLVFACALHDLGTSPVAGGTQRFEIDGADMAARFLTDNRVDKAAWIRCGRR